MPNKQLITRYSTDDPAVVEVNAIELDKLERELNLLMEIVSKIRKIRDGIREVIDESVLLDKAKGI